MASWTNIANVALDVGKPARAVDVLALRDNPIALAEGRPGAPRISPWAMVEPVVAGDVSRFRPQMIFYSTTTGWTLHATASVANSGTVRIKATHSRTSGTGQSRLRIDRVRAGVYSTIVAETTTTPLAFDTDLEPGDTFMWYHRCQDSGAICQLSGVELATDGGVLFPMAPYFSFGTAPA